MENKENMEANNPSTSDASSSEELGEAKNPDGLTPEELIDKRKYLPFLESLLTNSTNTNSVESETKINRIKKAHGILSSSKIRKKEVVESVRNWVKNLLTLVAGGKFKKDIVKQESCSTEDLIAPDGPTDSIVEPSSTAVADCAVERRPSLDAEDAVERGATATEVAIYMDWKLDPIDLKPAITGRLAASTGCSADPRNAKDHAQPIVYEDVSPDEYEDVSDSDDVVILPSPPPKTPPSPIELPPTPPPCPSPEAKDTTASPQPKSPASTRISPVPLPPEVPAPLSLDVQPSLPSSPPPLPPLPPLPPSPPPPLPSPPSTSPGPPPFNRLAPSIAELSPCAPNPPLKSCLRKTASAPSKPASPSKSPLDMAVLATAVLDGPTMAASNAETSVECPPPVMFQNTDLVELIAWTNSRLSSGKGVSSLLADAIKTESPKDSEPVGESQPSTAVAQSDTFYREATPFHLLHKDVTPVVRPVVPILSQTRPKRPKGVAVKKEFGERATNKVGDVIDLEYEEKLEEMKRSQGMPQEPPDQVNGLRDPSSSDMDISDVDEGRGKERPPPEARKSREENAKGVAAAGTSSGIRAHKPSHEHYRRIVEEKRREKDQQIKRDARKREERRRDYRRRMEEKERERERAAQAAEQRRLEEHQRNMACTPQPLMMPGWMPYPPMMGLYSSGPPYPQQPSFHMQPAYCPPAPPCTEVPLFEPLSDKCVYCPYYSDPDHIMKHYVNHHLDREPPVFISKQQLAAVIQGESDDSDAGKESKILTGNKLLDDLSWIPNGSLFPEAVACKLCTYDTTFRKNLVLHVIQHRDAVLLQQSGGARAKSFYCRFCSRILSDVGMFHEHCTKHTGEFMHACGYCNYRGYRSDDVKVHITEEHPGRKIEVKSNNCALGGKVVYGYTCSKCGFLQMSEKKVERHIRVTHGAKETASAVRLSMSRKGKKSKPVQPLAAPATPSPVVSPTRPLAENTVTPVPRATVTNSPPKRRPPVKIRDDPRSATWRNPMDPNPTIRRKGRHVATTLTAAIPTAKPIGPLLENGAFEGEEEEEETAEDRLTSRVTEPSAPNASNGSSVEADKEEARSVQKLPDRVMHCKLEPAEAPPSPSGGEGTDGGGETDEFPYDDAGQGQQEVEVRVSALTSEMELTSQIEIENVVDENAAVQVKREQIESSETCAQDAVERKTGLPSIADTISKLQAQLQGNVAPSDAVTKKTSSIAGAHTMTSPVSKPKARLVMKLSPRRIGDWNKRKKSVICNCGFLGCSTEAFGRHWSQWHKSEKQMPCPECGTKFDNPTDYARHLHGDCVRVDDRQFVCSLEPLCRFLTSNRVCFENHVKNFHVGLQNLACHWCGDTFKSMQSLVEHIAVKCATRDSLLTSLKLTAAVNTNGIGSDADVTGGSTEEGRVSPLLADPAAPHLEVVYRCSVFGCGHESLEREVFTDHMQVKHPEMSKYFCLYCKSLTFKNLNMLVLHTEAEHREGLVPQKTVQKSPVKESPPVDNVAVAATVAATVATTSGATVLPTKDATALPTPVIPPAATSAAGPPDGASKVALTKYSLNDMEDVYRSALELR